MATKKAAATPKPEEKKKHVAIAIEVTHGHLFWKHKHHHVSVLEVSKDTNLEQIEEATEGAIRSARRLINIPARILVVEEVEIGGGFASVKFGR